MCSTNWGCPTYFGFVPFMMAGGGQSAPCYDPNHSHRPGYGRYMWEGMKQTMMQALNSASAENRSLGLSTEQTSELSIPYELRTNICKAMELHLSCATTGIPQHTGQDNSE